MRLLDDYKEEFIAAHNRIKPFIHNTPILTSSLINEMAESSLFFKCENFQKMGAFKMRGATNAIMQLSVSQKEKGVVTHSSGNFAQAVSLAAREQNVKAYIVMPNSAPQVKKDAVRGYGGEIIMCESTLEARESAAKKIEDKTGAVFLHPSNDEEVIIGQGTAAKELLEVHSDMDFLLVPVGGGGLVAGSILAASYFSRKCRVVGVEPLSVDDAYRSIISGRIESNDSASTVADGLKTMLGDKNFPIIKDGIDKIIRVTEQEIIKSMRLIWERLKIVCEPSSAVALAGILKEKDLYRGKKVGILISGGNVDLDNLPFAKNRS